MKQKTFACGLVYETPVVSEVTLASESILCASGSIEKFDFVEDESGWDL